MRGDISKLDVDAIVSAANTGMLGGGIYGFPIDEAAAIAVREIRAALSESTDLSSVLLVAFGDDVFSALCHSTTS